MDRTKITKEIPNLEFTNIPTDEVADQIAKILDKLDYDSVEWDGSIYMAPNTFMGWDTEFTKTETETKTKNKTITTTTHDSHREFPIGSETRNLMEEILLLLIENRIEFGWIFYSNTYEGKL